jgi:hypothetical protein
MCTIYEGEGEGEREGGREGEREGGKEGGRDTLKKKKAPTARTNVLKTGGRKECLHAFMSAQRIYIKDKRTCGGKKKTSMRTHTGRKTQAYVKKKNQ